MNVALHRGGADHGSNLENCGSRLAKASPQGDMYPMGRSMQSSHCDSRERVASFIEARSAPCRADSASHRDILERRPSSRLSARHTNGVLGADRLRRSRAPSFITLFERRPSSRPQQQLRRVGVAGEIATLVRIAFHRGVSPMLPWNDLPRIATFAKAAVRHGQLGTLVWYGLAWSDRETCERRPSSGLGSRGWHSLGQCQSRRL